MKNKYSIILIIFLLIIISTVSLFFIFMRSQTNNYVTNYDVNQTEDGSLDREVPVNIEIKSVKDVSDKENSTSIQTKKNEIDWNALENKIINILLEDNDNYAVYIRDLDSEGYLSINGEMTFPPASIYKVPLAILTLRRVEAGELTLDSPIFISQASKAYDTDLMSNIPGEYDMKLGEVLDYLIKYSDNTAMTALESSYAGSASQVQQDIKDILKIQNFTRDPFESSAEDISLTLENLYNEKYLNSENTKYLLNLMKNSIESLKDRIPVGLPKDIETSHKIGTWLDTHADAGIVYGAKRDYIIVVLNNDTTIHIAREKISKISEVTYEALNVN